MSDQPPKPAASPRPPDDSAPLSLDKTPSSFLVTVPYVQAKEAKILAKLREAEHRMAYVAEQTARSAARDERGGRPRIPPWLTPWFAAGFTLFGAITSVVVGDPAMPVWLVKVATIGTAFFGGMLGLSSGLRRK